MGGFFFLMMIFFSEMNLNKELRVYSQEVYFLVEKMKQLI